MESYYKMSGNSNKIGLILSLIIIMIFSIILGYVYTIISIWIPLVYVKLFITIGLGFVILHTILLLTRLTKNRNKRSQIWLTIIFCALTFYLQWCGYVMYAISYEMPYFPAYLNSLPLFINPFNLFPIIFEINQIGMWSVFKISFTGFFLWLVWIIEAGIIFGLPILGVLKTEPNPFSEKLNKWYKRYILDDDFEGIAAATQVKQGLFENPVELIKNFKPGNGFNHTKIYLYYLPKEEKQYISLARISGSNSSKAVSIVINKMELNTYSAKAILDEFKHSSNFLDQY